jgi:NADH dehydrogenase
VIGAGFGGLYVARGLRKAAVSLTVVDRHNYHLFQPLMYQVATAGLSPGDIAYPIRVILRRQKNTDVLLAEVSAIDIGARRVHFSDGDFLEYDYLVVAAGASHSYFGHDEWAANAPGLKTLEDALEIRRRILLAFEQAEREAELEKRKALLTFVVVGGGPTGVEMAGAIAEIACKVMVEDFRAINPRESRVVMIEAGPRILAAFPPDLSEAAEKQLARLGVEVLKNCAVTDVTATGVVAGRETIAASTVIWAAGVAASGLARTLGVTLDRQGRVPVEKDLSIPGHPEVFVIGDLANFPHQTGKPLAGLAPVAIQQGKYVARLLTREARTWPAAAGSRKPFHYLDKGTLATVGRAAAVADFGFVHFKGAFAWLIWVFVHVLTLVGFRNRVVVSIEWLWAYLSWEKVARLITGPTGSDFRK